MKSRKRRYIQNTSEDDSDKENDELRLHLTITPDEEEEDKISRWMPEGLTVVLWGVCGLFNPDVKMSFWGHNRLEDYDRCWLEKKYPLEKEVLMQMLKLKLESEEDNTMALELIKFVKKILAELESEELSNWLSPISKRLVERNYSNLFMVDNLPKIVGLSTYLAFVVMSWLVMIKQCFGKELFKSVDS
ncbi:hypothetical protein Tco_0060838 [Tanacetum coccineum]